MSPMSTDRTDGGVPPIAQYRARLRDVSRALIGVVLNGIDLNGDVVNGRRGTDLSALDEGDAGVVAAVDRLDGESGDLGQRRSNVVLAQKGSGDIGGGLCEFDGGLVHASGYVGAQLFDPGI